MPTFTHKVIHAGQPRPYADSVFKFEVVASPDATDEQVWAHCQTLRRASNRDDRQRHDGSCGFPYGLSSYGSLNKRSATVWSYEVTEPYCD